MVLIFISPLIPYIFSKKKTRNKDVAKIVRTFWGAYRHVWVIGYFICGFKMIHNHLGLMTCMTFANLSIRFYHHEEESMLRCPIVCDKSYFCDHHEYIMNTDKPMKKTYQITSTTCRSFLNKFAIFAQNTLI